MHGKNCKCGNDIAGGIIFVGILLTGIGLGIYYSAVVVGTIVGLGLGLVFFGLMKSIAKE